MHSGCSTKAGWRIRAPSRRTPSCASTARSSQRRVASCPQAEEAILDLAAVGMSVGKVIDVIPEPDEEIRQQLARLVERGLIALVD